MSGATPEREAGPVRKWWRRIIPFVTSGEFGEVPVAAPVETIGSVQLMITPGVTNPCREHTGEFLAHCLRDDPPAARTFVLDLATGSGVGAIFAAKFGAVVDAVDSALDAVECARGNATLNRTSDRITFHHGDLYEPVGDRRFHRVLFAPSVRPELDPEHAAIEAQITHVAEGLAAHLTPDGVGWIVLPSHDKRSRTLDAIRAMRLDVSCIRTVERSPFSLSLFELRANG